ncbi:hypothetical protein [Bradyrhizobium prioriisuperbiae]|uniref:hypothetical protein n=1 Tax=Bradyrhizobium prioriisuperbiae TaxID=2854389 RepID=UPI0028E2846D|nr:hypothetical protein [Bradyrhizobium prioritasuperba]
MEFGSTPGTKSGGQSVSIASSAPVTERQISSKRRDIARLRDDIRLQQAEMQALIANDIDCTAAATRLLEMRLRLARLIGERDAMMAAFLAASKV